MKIPRVVVASTHSGAGKTTVAVGLMTAFSKRGLCVQPFKVGPDFIDPSYHRAAANVHSKNLDTWLTSPEVVREIFIKSTCRCDVAVIEGVMGLFDGAKGSDDSASTAEISRILKAPVILVIDVSRMAGSSAALVHGFKTYDQKLNLRGVILNHVKSGKHTDLAREAIEGGAGVRVVGALPSSADISMPTRHLGLIPALEQNGLADFLTRLGVFAEEHLALDQILEIARDADELEFEQQESSRPVVAAKARIGIAYDEAFNFYYQDNIELLEANGAEIVHFSPIHDLTLPNDLDGVFLGGGFPETYAKQLEDNQSMRRSVKKAVEDEMPVYAECGGLIYLMESLEDLNGHQHRMVGVLNGKVIMSGKLESLNYSVARVVRKNLLSELGSTLRGHEFHYSKVIDIPRDAKFAYEMQSGKGILGRRDGWMQHNLLASYMHIHFAGDPRIARNFVEACGR
jgi:cobyrinic acid a,c-diamide synthase